MSKITTEDCKTFLLDTYPDKKTVNWKRIRKFKDENGATCREFSHSAGIQVCLIEENGQLSVLTNPSNSFSDKSMPVEPVKKATIAKLSASNEKTTEHDKKAEFTLFDEASQKAAKRLVNAFVKPKEDPITPNSSVKGFNAIPNLIYFSFLEDANCDETEYLEEIAQAMNFKATMRDIAVFFMPSTVKSMCDHLSPLIEDFLPVPLYEVEEMSFKINDCDTALSVTDVFEQLTKAGFVYNPEGCALKSLFTQYQLINVEPVVNKDDKTADYKKAFLAALKKDDVVKVKALIEDGLPLNLKVGRHSLLGQSLHDNCFECFKYLCSLYPNTANVGNGVCDQVWEYVWASSKCSYYFMDHAAYDFTHSNKKAHSELISTLVHKPEYFNKVTQKVNQEYFSVSCLECTLTYDRAYHTFKDYVKKAIEDYPDSVSSNKYMVEQLVYGFIIPPILDLLAASLCTFNGKTVFEVVQAKIDEIGHDPKGYINQINVYRAFLRKHGR